VTATVTAVTGAIAYAWFVSTTTGLEKLAAITAANQLIITQAPASTQQPITNLQVANAYQDNSTNALLPDGILTQIYGSVFGAAPGTAMSTNQTALAANLTIGSSGALVYTMPTANTGLTISGTNITEFDTIMQAAYDLYKVGYDRILMSSTDLTNSLGSFFGSGDTAAGFRMIFDADQASGRIVAGRRVTTYMNKVMNKPLDIDVHPFVPPGTIIFWSDRVPYELSGVGNLFEAIVRQDYYQIEWPWKTMRYEYGVYVDEVFANYFLPAFAVIRNVNPTSGSPKF
jgi:hypothetical protein